MELIRSIFKSDNFKAIANVAKNGDKILLYEGDWNSFEACPDGIIIRKGDQFFLNGVDLICESDARNWAASPVDSRIIFLSNGGAITINGKEVIWNDDWENFYADIRNPRGIVVQREDTILCNNSEVICRCKHADWYCDPKDPKSVIIQEDGGRFLRNGVQLIGEYENDEWRPYGNGIITLSPHDPQLFFNDDEQVYRHRGRDWGWEVLEGQGVIIGDDDKEQIFLVVGRV